MRVSTGAFLAALLPDVAAAQSIGSTFDCRVTLTCNAVGTCAQGDEATAFTLDPVDAERHGEGEYIIKYGDVSAPASFVPHGPFIMWAALDNTLNTLAFSGYWAPETDMSQVRAFWQALGPENPSVTTIRFMTCEVNL